MCHFATWVGSHHFRHEYASPDVGFQRFLVSQVMIRWHTTLTNRACKRHCDRPPVSPNLAHREQSATDTSDQQQGASEVSEVLSKASFHQVITRPFPVLARISPSPFIICNKPLARLNNISNPIHTFHTITFLNHGNQLFEDH